MQLDWVSFGEYENYDTTALYHTYTICESCFALFKAVDELRKLELEYAWRLGIVTTRNGTASIPEGSSIVTQV